MYFKGSIVRNSWHYKINWLVYLINYDTNDGHILQEKQDSLNR